eukprot:3405979-Pleurochrysis_carterae.AAC.1
MGSQIRRGRPGRPGNASACTWRRRDGALGEGTGVEACCACGRRKHSRAEAAIAGADECVAAEGAEHAAQVCESECFGAAERCAERQVQPPTPAAVRGATGDGPRLGKHVASDPNALHCLRL